MLIVIEGPDGSGKTTLAKQLAERFGLTYHHEGPPPKDIPALEHYGAVLENLRQEKVVFDRFALGERVYGPVLRGVDGLGEEGWNLIQRLFRATNVFTILCLPAYDTCYRAWSSGREELVKDNFQFNAIYNRYFGYKGSNLIDYDYTESGSFEQLCRVVDRWFKTLKPLPPGYVGNVGYTYLFVGERGSNPKAKHSLPFFATTGSSEYLNRAIKAARFSEYDIALVNAYANDGTPRDLIEAPMTIALGKIAVDAVLRARAKGRKGPLSEMPHPQYWKRFHANEFDRYVELLQQCRL